MKILLILVCFAVGLSACHNKNVIPGNILNKDQMQDVLWDIMEADAFTNSFIKKGISKNPVLEDEKLQEQIFAIHHISKEDFYKSYSYYKEHPGLMLTILDSITTKKSREENIPVNKKINHPLMSDSIRMQAIKNRDIQLKKRIDSVAMLNKLNGFNAKVKKKKKNKRLNSKINSPLSH
jgi:hypothetical protein